jgi:hypothetical protein
MANYLLPEPPTGDELIKAVRASLEVLTVAPPKITYPLLASPYRVVLGSVDFADNLCGTTGGGKSELAALIQSHFGLGFTARTLPANWEATANALEELAFQAKDVILTIDDFCPSGDASSVSRLHQTAQRIFRGQGNAGGRARLNRNSELRPAHPPRGMILSTGEDYPRGQSILARQLVLLITKGDIDFAILSRLQANAAAGLFAASLAGYLAWILPKYDQVVEAMKKQVPLIRTEAASDRRHPRTPGIVADLAFGFRLFLKFAADVGAITQEERASLRDRCWAALLGAADDQQAYQATSDNAKFFMTLLNAALGTGRVHLADFKTDSPPENYAAYGWRKEMVGRAEEIRPQGNCVGWVNEHYLYLERDAAYAEMQQFARDQNLSITTSASKLWKTMDEQKMLALTEKEHGTLAVRRQVHGNRRYVLCLLASNLDATSENPPITPITGTTPGDNVPADAIQEPSGRVPAGESEGCGRENGDNPPTKNTENYRAHHTPGRNGRVSDAHTTTSGNEEYQF